MSLLAVRPNFPFARMHGSDNIAMSHLTPLYIPSAVVVEDRPAYSASFDDVAVDFAQASYPDHSDAAGQHVDSSVTASSSASPAPVPSASIIPSDPQEDCEPELSADDSLLQFSEEEYIHEALLNRKLEQTAVSLAARMHGLFTLTDPQCRSPPCGAGGSTAKPIQLAFSRRNMMQVTGRVRIPRDLAHIWTSLGQQIEISRMMLSVSCTESSEDLPMKMWIQVGKNKFEKKLEESGPIPIDMVNGRGTDPDFVDVAFEWKRLVFKMATANNGRRHELQQTFRVFVKLDAELVSGEIETLAQVKTHGIVVRGRGPLNFKNKRDKPIKGTRHHGRKKDSLPGQIVSPADHDLPPQYSRKRKHSDAPVSVAAISTAAAPNTTVLNSGGLDSSAVRQASIALLNEHAMRQPHQRSQFLAPAGQISSIMPTQQNCSMPIAPLWPTPGFTTSQHTTTTRAQRGPAVPMLNTSFDMTHGGGQLEPPMQRQQRRPQVHTHGMQSMQPFELNGMTLSQQPQQSQQQQQQQQALIMPTHGTFGREFMPLNDLVSPAMAMSATNPTVDEPLYSYFPVADPQWGSYEQLQQAAVPPVQMNASHGVMPAQRHDSLSMPSHDGLGNKDSI